MQIAFKDQALQALKFAPTTVQKAFIKQIKFLGENLRHPSLRAKKFSETENI